MVEPLVVCGEVPVEGSYCEQIVQDYTRERELRRAAYGRLEIEPPVLFGGGGRPPYFESFFGFLPYDPSQVCQRWLSALGFGQRGCRFCQSIGLFVARDAGMAWYPAHLCSTM